MMTRPFFPLVAGLVLAFVAFVTLEATGWGGDVPDDAEMSANLRKLYDASVAYYESEHVGPDGKVLPKQFPASVPLTPAKDCCREPNKVCAPSAKAFDNKTWKALEFSLPGPSHWRYEYKSSGQDKAAQFSVRAVGDPKCDGHEQIWERRGTIDPKEGFVSSGSGTVRVK